jgi:inorganic pyrophosphatase
VSRSIGERRPVGLEDERFWAALDTLIATCGITVDRPRGSAHPRHVDVVYPLDYGFLAGTSAMDGAGIDVWLGTQDARTVSGFVLTVDPAKRDSEMKVLIGCTPEETAQICEFHRSGAQSAVLVPRTDAGDRSSSSE